MYKAIIVDDEEAVRNGLNHHFDWAAHGVTVVETFPDCAKAYAYIKENPVDLVVTDVITPYMDGITLAQKLRAEFPAIQIVFVSGHADVQFLREAMKSDAIDYILKSVDLDELSVTITRVVNLLDHRLREEKRVTEMEDQLRELLPLHRERVLRSLLDEDGGEFTCALYLGLELDPASQYICIVIRLTNKWTVCKGLSASDVMALSMDCERICKEAIAEKPGSFCFKNRSSEYIVILKYEPDDYERDILEISTYIQKRITAQTELESTVGISEPSGLTTFYTAYEEACEAIEQHYYLTENSSITLKKYEEVQDQKALREYVEKHLPDAILSGQIAQVDAVLDQIFGTMRLMPPNEWDNSMLFLLLSPSWYIPGLRTLSESPYQNQRKLIDQWMVSPFRVEQERFLRQIMSEITQLMRTGREPGASAIIWQIKTIIGEQYMEQISVTSLANQVHLTPTYLCVLFKESTGKTINEYLTAERIRHAKRLLRDPTIRLYDVCYQVGYLSPSYFSRLFKKQTGMPPGEYRAQMLNEPMESERS